MSASTGTTTITCSRPRTKSMPAMMWANLHLLFWLSLFPFVTGWMGENHFTPAPTALYGAVMLLAAIAYYILQSIIVAQHGRDSTLAASPSGAISRANSRRCSTPSPSRPRSSGRGSPAASMCLWRSCGWSLTAASPEWWMTRVLPEPPARRSAKPRSKGRGSRPWPRVRGVRARPTARPSESHC